MSRADRRKTVFNMAASLAPNAVSQDADLLTADQVQNASLNSIKSLAAAIIDSTTDADKKQQLQALQVGLDDIMSSQVRIRAAAKAKQYVRSLTPEPQLGANDSDVKGKEQMLTTCDGENGLITWLKSINHACAGRTQRVWFHTLTKYSSGKLLSFLEEVRPEAQRPSILI